jgi:hypothetical protein
VKFQIATLAAAVLFVVAAYLAGDHRAAALTGASIAGSTAVISIFAMGRAVRSTRKPTQAALAVVVGLFLLRLVLVGVGTVLVARAGLNAVAFVVAFFVPHFAFSALEGAFVHSMSRMGSPA